ncbi:MAG: arginase [Armatimonadia bacterium]|nr:arginase [Armatimonadia bacterium]
MTVDSPLTVAPDVGFINAPVHSDLSTLEADVAILGVPCGMPYSIGQSRSCGAPAYIREKSMRFGSALGERWNFDLGGEMLDGRDVRVVDCGDVRSDPLDFPGTVARATEAVHSILQAGAVPVIIGGDDSVPIPVLRAYEGFGPVTVVQIDEHLDFKDEIRGQREGYSSPMRRISEMPWVERSYQVALHGQGSALTSDRNDALAAGNVLITEREVHERGVSWLLEQIPAGRDYFVTIDLDGFDPSVFPCVSHPEPGGLTFHEGDDLLRGLAERGRVVGIDFVEIVPEHDLHALGAHSLGRLVVNLVGTMVRGGRPL